MTFCFMSLVPLICSGLTLIPTIVGMALVMAILSYMVLSNNFRVFKKNNPGLGRNAKVLWKRQIKR